MSAAALATRQAVRACITASGARSARLGCAAAPATRATAVHRVCAVRQASTTAGATATPSAGIAWMAAGALGFAAGYTLYEDGGFYPSPVPASASGEEAEGTAATTEGDSDPAAAAPAAGAGDGEEADAATPAAAEAPPPPEPLSAQYVLVGGGTATYFAVRGILSRDPTAKILIVTAEDRLPYMRPPLSKELWFREGDPPASDTSFVDWGGTKRDLEFEKAGFYCEATALSAAPEDQRAVALLKGRKVEELNVEAKVLTLDDGTAIAYSKLLLATGGKPKNIPAIERLAPSSQSQVTLFRTLDDYQGLMDSVRPGSNVVVIGGGFLGSELAVALATKFKKHNVVVNQVFPEDGNMGYVLPHYLSTWTTGKVEAAGVNVVHKSLVTNAYPVNDRIVLELDSGTKMTTDHVVVAVGLEPNAGLAKQARLEIDPVQGGILVNAEMEARTDVWAAGDVSSFYDRNLGRRRVEHYDHAAVSGRLAGENMAGAREPYFHQSMFWSDLGPDVGYEAIGRIDSALPTVGVWAKATPADTPKAAALAGQVQRAGLEGSDHAEATGAVDAPAAAAEQGQDEFGKGVVYYLEDKRVVGVVLWNIFGKIPVARRLIRQAETFEDLSDLKSVIKVHETDAH